MTIGISSGGLATPVSVTNGGTGLSSTTINQVLYSSAANTIAGLATVALGILNTDSSGVPSITQTPSINSTLAVGSSTGITSGYMFDVNDPTAGTRSSVFFRTGDSTASILINTRTSVQTNGSLIGGLEMDGSNSTPTAALYTILRAYIVSNTAGSHSGEQRIIIASNGSNIQGFSVIGNASSEANVVCGKLSALATNATDGFLYIPSSAGAPTGTPTAYTGKVAIQYDTTNNKIYVYNGAWKSTAALA